MYHSVVYKEIYNEWYGDDKNSWYLFDNQYKLYVEHIRDNVYNIQLLDDDSDNVKMNTILASSMEDAQLIGVDNMKGYLYQQVLRWQKLFNMVNKVKGASDNV